MAYFADRAGLGERSRESLVAALEEFCLDSLSSIQGTEEPLDVAIEDFEDRIQIVVEYPTRRTRRRPPGQRVPRTENSRPSAWHSVG